MSPKSKKVKEAAPAGGDVEALSFEAAFEALEAVVARLESGEPALEDALALYARGQALAARCGQLLDRAELRVRALTPEGTLAPFEAGEAEG